MPRTFLRKEGNDLGCKPSEIGSALGLFWIYPVLKDVFGLPIPACSYKKLSISERSGSTSDDCVGSRSAGHLLFPYR